MKKIKVNQVIIAVMTVALGVAGYINFSGNSINLADSGKDETKPAFGEVIDASEAPPMDVIAPGDDSLYAEENIVLEDEEYGTIEFNSESDQIGKAVLTSSPVATDAIITAKMNREQVRSKNKEAYLAIINGESSDGISVEDATSAYIKLTEDSEKESEVETLLLSQGFNDPIVSIGEDNVDVIVNCESLDEVSKAKIEEIVVRKTGFTVDKIAITCAKQ